MGLRLGYLVPEFPGQPHAFFCREIACLRRMGETVPLLSTRNPSPLICRHDFAPDALSETHYLFPPGIAGLGAWVAHGRRRFGEAIAYLSELEHGSLKSCLRSCALLAS